MCHSGHHTEPLAGCQIGRGHALEHRQCERGTHGRTYGARVRGISRTGAKCQPVGTKCRRRAYQRAHVAGIGHTGEIHPKRRRHHHGAKVVRPRLREDGDDARRLCERAGAGHQLSGGAVALAEADRREKPWVVGPNPLLVNQQHDRLNTVVECRLHKVLALGHEEALFTACALLLQAAQVLERGIARRGHAAERRIASAAPLVIRFGACGQTAARASAARAHSAAKCSGSWIARSASILRSSSTPARPRPWMNSP